MLPAGPDGYGQAGPSPQASVQLPAAREVLGAS